MDVRGMRCRRLEVEGEQHLDSDNLVLMLVRASGVVRFHGAMAWSTDSLLIRLTEVTL